MRPIDADIVQQMIDKAEKLFESKECYEEHRQKYFNCNCLRYFIDKFPTLDVAPVRHGTIIHSNENGKSKRTFSCCKSDFTQLTMWMVPNYCPNCGAKMNLEEQDET